MSSSSQRSLNKKLRSECKAAFGKASVIASLLLQGADPNFVDDAGLTPLMHAVLISTGERMGPLLNHKKTNLLTKGRQGFNVFHLIAVSRSVEAANLKALLCHDQAIEALVQPDNRGLNPLEVAQRAGNVGCAKVFRAVMKIVVEAINEIETESAPTEIVKAARFGKVSDLQDIVDLKVGAEVIDVRSTFKGLEELTPLMICCIFCDPTEDNHDDYLKCIAALLKAGANPTLRIQGDKNKSLHGCSVLDCVFVGGSLRALEVIWHALRARNVDPNIRVQLPRPVPRAISGVVPPCGDCGSPCQESSFSGEGYGHFGFLCDVCRYHIAIISPMRWKCSSCSYDVCYTCNPSADAGRNAKWQQVRPQVGYYTSPLEAAIGTTSVDMVKFVVSQGADLTNVSDQGTALHLSATTGDPAIHQYLLSMRVNLTRPNILGFNPLHLAAQNGYASLVRQTLAVHPELVNTLTPTGDTALMLACHKGTHDVVIDLLKFQPDVDMVNAAGMTAMQIALSRNDAGLADLIRPFVSAKPASKAAAGDLATVCDDLQFDSSQLTRETSALAEGANGRIFRGTYSGTPVAIKCPKSFASRASKDEFRKETQAWKSLRHPHVVQLFGAIEDPPQIIMELMATSLYHLIHGKFMVLSIHRKIKYALDIIKGLSYLHYRTFLHRDLKALNVLISLDFNEAKLADFGLTRTFAAHEGTSGTLAFMAPELLQGLPPTQATDIYAFAVTLFELIAEESPYQGRPRDTPETMHRHLNSGGRPLRTTPVDPAEPPQIKRLIETCWQTEPARRPDSKAVLQILQHLADQFPFFPSQMPAQSSSMAGPPRSNTLPNMMPAPPGGSLDSFASMLWEKQSGTGTFSSPPPVPHGVPRGAFRLPGPQAPPSGPTALGGTLPPAAFRGSSPAPSRGAPPMALGGTLPPAAFRGAPLARFPEVPAAFRGVPPPAFRGGPAAPIGFATEGARLTMDIFEAIRKQNMPQIQANLRADPKVVSSVDVESQTPLHVAIFEEDYHVIELLLKAGSNPLAKDKSGSTCLSIAEECDMTRIVALLKQYCR